MRSGPSFALPLLLAACTTTGAGESPSLAGSEWRFTAIDGAPPTGGERATLAIEADRISASAGCNRLGAGWRHEQGRIVLTGPLISTQMYCESVMEQERALGALLSDKPALVVTGDAMTLKSAQHAAELRRVAPR